MSSNDVEVQAGASGSSFHYSSSPFGVVDIGSNTVRLVIYRRLVRNPLAIWNEKLTCALGRGLQETGRLNETGKNLALRALARYASIARAMGITDLDLVATAAVRDASDGEAFVAEIEALTGLRATILTGEQEARMAALGVLCALPDAEGMVADLGGGSVELIMVGDGDCQMPYTSLPLGLLRLTEAAGGDLARAQGILEDSFDRLSWLRETAGRPLYAVGGAWRSLARICIHLKSYPLHVLDNFSLDRDEALALLDRIVAMTPEEMRTVPGISDKRLPAMPFAAVALRALLERAGSPRLVFSVYGLREGRFFSHLSPSIRGLDPLLASCESLARTASRFPAQGHELMEWMTPLFGDETPPERRLRLAACLLGDVFWSEHPDYRAEQAFQRVIKLPFMGLSHLDRALLALMLHYRYTNEAGDDWVTRAHAVVGERGVARARAVGQALRLGFTISAGAVGLLRRASLDLQGDELLLRLPGNEPAYLPELFSKRLGQLARTLQKRGRLVFDPD
ncbi:Ppx/GppA family phosphatase [Phaeovibrio sulfidiphilus]|uniref:Ppx/GppA family phosphatase n=1 Tax=Phaeovibrio sulfidiphilus TaxID=1220600 RepID=A0A8J6YL57_9PROT|nr:Ppx/GppA family phosphatase [Phaeovibrio sulfidiphilus]MBE1236715.1 Ppx/GppA family phosphatase [Phaeovibrio sulfidiphilus]